MWAHLCFEWRHTVTHVAEEPTQGSGQDALAYVGGSAKHGKCGGHLELLKEIKISLQNGFKKN